jgi:hypothetical protein
MNKTSAIGLSYLAVAGWWALPALSSKDGIAAERSSIATSSTPNVSVAAAAVKKTSKDSPAKLPTKRLKIEIDVTNPSDLLVKEGQKVEANQLIADRSLERNNLATQLQEVNLSIERLRTAPKVSPLPPVGVRELKSLPKVSYVEEQAQVSAAAAKLKDVQRKYTLVQTVAKTPLPESGKVRVSRTAVQQAQETLRKQQQKLDALLTLNEIDPAIQEHERTKLGELQQALIEAQAKLEQDLAVEGLAKANRASQIEEVRFEVTIAERDVQLARARLSTAIEKRKQLEFEHQIKQAERGEQLQRLELERVKLRSANKLQEHDREYQIAQLVLKKIQIQKQLETLAGVKTPHQGTIRRVKLVSQHGNLMRYEVGLVYSLNPSPIKTANVSQWQDF